METATQSRDYERSTVTKTGWQSDTYKLHIGFKRQSWEEGCRTKARLSTKRLREGRGGRFHPDWLDTYAFSRLRCKTTAPALAVGTYSGAGVAVRRAHADQEATMSDTSNDTTADEQIYELYLVDDRLVQNPEEGNLIDSYEGREEAEEAKKRKYRANDLHPGSYEVRPADGDVQEPSAKVDSQSSLTFDTLLCEGCAPSPLKPARLEKIGEERGEDVTRETFRCPSCGEDYTVSQYHGRDRARLDRGIITAQEADQRRREAAGRVQ